MMATTGSVQLLKLGAYTPYTEQAPEMSWWRPQAQCSCLG